jgi:NitT/TauT family transport system substrate-binding protein
VLARFSRRSGVVGLAALVGALAVLSAASTAVGSPQATTVTVATLPIANALPMDLGIKKGFFDQQGIEIKKSTLASGNDVVLAMANKNADIGYLGFVPMMIARTQGIPLQLVAASEVEGTNGADNWQNILVKGSSSIQRPTDLAGKTIAVNALKGVGEVMIKAALKKLKVDPSSVKLVALPFPSMRAALNNGQVDAIWVPEPFLTQGLTIDNDRIVMAPGPVLGPFWPIGGYAALQDWAKSNADTYRKFRNAINQSLTYAQAHPDEIRALLPSGTPANVRLPIWSPLVDRATLVQLAKYSKEFGVISTLPNMAALVPSSIASGLVLQGIVGASTIILKLEGKRVTQLNPGKYTFVVWDRSSKQNFSLDGPGVHKKTSVRGVGRSTWTVTLKKGTYRYGSSAKASLKRTFKVG